MSGFDTEEEQVAAVKKWWKENGSSLLLGLAIGLGGVGGWTYWQEYNLDRSQNASSAYEDLVQLAVGPDAGDSMEPAVLKAGKLVAEHEGTPYAALARLLLARVYLENGDDAAARGELEWVLANETSPEIKGLASLRLARLRVSAGEFDEALSDLGAEPPAGFEGMYAELRGDIFIKQGKTADARAAYQQALLSASDRRTFIEMKLDDLGTVSTD